VVVLLFTFALRGSLGFGGAVGLPLLALVIPVKVLAPAWSLIGIASSAAIIGRDREHVAKREFLRLLPGCALGIAAGLFFFKTLDAVLLARALGAFIILYAIYSLWMSTRPADSAPPVPPAVLRPLASLLSGAVGTLFGSMASIFFAMYLDASGANKQATLFSATVCKRSLTAFQRRSPSLSSVSKVRPRTMFGAQLSGTGIQLCRSKKNGRLRTLQPISGSPLIGPRYRSTRLFKSA
jgi:uncharacterized membrane protein YfcA